MEFNHNKREAEIKNYWKDNNIYKVAEDKSKPKFYVLDMFPYPSGAGLHVGHPLGYIASDIIARYKKMSGYCVLHPMGFDAFGLPAEQYAIQTGQHPSVSTHDNIETYKKQLDNIGFNYDWSREIRTCDPHYYKWTQWIFIRLFNHYYCTKTNQAKSIDILDAHFKCNGSRDAFAFGALTVSFNSEEYNNYSIAEKLDILMNFRLAYRKKSFVNWCEALGTVLANDEVKDGVSERGGHPVIKKPMLQWALRITAYAERLLNDLDNLAWSDSLKLMQQNWIGKSEGAFINFQVEDSDHSIQIYTTRADTIFGCTFVVLAPEHPLLDKIIVADRKSEIESFIHQIKQKSEIERQSITKNASGIFTGAYAIHPFTKNKIPIWIADYVLIEYGTGAIMAVPSNDHRDNVFAKKYELEIIEVVDQSAHSNATIEDKVGRMVHSEFLNGLDVLDALLLINQELESRGIGKSEVQYRLRDANFSRQRYWGEPFPILYDQNGTAISVDDSKLPVESPWMDEIKIGTGGQSPLVHATDWVTAVDNHIRETDTMPGYAGSSWYFLRYMDPHNNDSLASKERLDYWQDVDLYIGGTEHAVGHLMYSRFWHKFLYDTGIVTSREPFKKLVNQGMIQGEINRIYLKKNIDGSVIINYADAAFVKKENSGDYAAVEVPLRLIKKDANNKSYLDKDTWMDFIKFRGHHDPSTVTISSEHPEAVYYLDSEIGKMSKRYHNVVNPDDVVAEYGADCFRMYEMFLGPLEQSKPWDTKGISGVAGFLRKYYSLFFQKEDSFYVSQGEPSPEELKVLHTCIKKVNEDIQQLSFNTAVSAFMICVNQLRSMQCTNADILMTLNRLLAPFAPFITEDIWQHSKTDTSIHHTSYPLHDDKFLVEDNVTYPVSINGKKRYEWIVAKTKTPQEVESEVLELLEVKKWIDGHEIKKLIIIPNRMINIVI